ncbi:exported protein of unknown function [Xenorhabdus doucetiae]|uniref:Uncharacterized protein n=1 Tax=Xenorhabdus doucetiae TaxID=351671 RepID=A0A068QMU4_9GAMM|nr:exported protein of unknown function [Xenorhabdus doucetiae]
MEKGLLLFILLILLKSMSHDMSYINVELNSGCFLSDTFIQFGLGLNI